MPAEASITVGNPGEGPSRIPATMKTGIAESLSRPASTLAAASVTRTRARSLNSSRRAFGRGAEAPGDY